MQSRLDAAQQLLPLPHSLGKSLASLLTLRLKRSKACRLRQKVESYTGFVSDSISFAGLPSSEKLCVSEDLLYLQLLCTLLAWQRVHQNLVPDIDHF